MPMDPMGPVAPWLQLTGLVLLASLAGGLLRVLRGPTRADRMLAGQLAGTVGVALLLVLSALRHEPALRDAALIFALLAAVTVVAFVRRAWHPDEGQGVDG